MNHDLKDLMEAVLSIQEGTCTLPSLSASFPKTWQEVMGDLNQRVKAKETQTLGASRSHALKILANADQTLQTKNSKQLQGIIQAKMTVMAIDQFADVLTGKIGPKPRLTDQALMKYMVLPSLQSGKALSMRAFDKLWQWFIDPLWAAGELQRQGFWSVPTAELLMRFKQQAAERSVLEIAAGRGLYVAGLDHLGVSVLGVDDHSWEHQDKVVAKAVPHMLKLDATAALKQHLPTVVICSWPPPDNDFEKEIFAAKSVQLYLAIVSKHSFASGNWREYQKQKSFHCTTSEPLNQMLRPIELEQQVLIFRRI